MSGYRRAAVALYGLDAGDRAAILAALPRTDQEQLEALLVELKTLGFSPDAAALAVAGDPAPELAQDRLALASPEELFRVLAQEPDGLTAHLLQVREWPWRADLLDLFPPDRRSAILALRPEPAPALQAALLPRLAACLPHHAAVARVQWRTPQFLRRWWRG